MNTTTQIPMSRKIGYGFATFGESIGYNVFYIYFIFFLTDLVGLDAGVAGTIALVAVFWNAFTDMFAGYASDRSRNPKGRRRPFIMKFAIPLSISFFFLFSNFETMSPSMQVVYFILINMVYWLFFSLVDMPYISLGAEITDDYEERTSIRTIVTMFNYTGMIVASSGTIMLVTKLGNYVVKQNAAWNIMAAIYGLIIVISFFISVWATKGGETIEHQELSEGSKYNIAKECLEIVKIKPYRYILLHTLSSFSGVMLATSIYIYYLTYNMAYSETTIATIMLAYSIMVIVLSPILGKLSSKYGKRNILSGATLIYGITCILFWIIDTNYISIYIIFASMAITVSAYFVVAYSMTYDICEVDEFINEKRREGTIISFFSFVMKISIGCGMAITGWILRVYQYNPIVQTQTEIALGGISLGMLLTPGILSIIGALIVFKYPLNSTKFNDIKIALEQKAEGKPYSTDSFKDLL